jgi:hypothetical protein
MRHVALAMRGRRGKFTRDPTGETSPRAYLFDELFAERYEV